MTVLRRNRTRALFVALPVLLAGCGADVVDGSGASASGTRSGDFPSRTGTGDAPTPVPGTSDPSTDGSSSAPDDALVSLSSVTGTATTVALDPGFIRGLGALRITPGLQGSTKLVGNSLVLPVTGGTATVFAPGAPQPVTASVEHSGSGLSLTAAGTTISITELRLDLGDEPQLNATVTANGKLVVRSATVFDIDDTAVRATGSAGTVTVTGVDLQMDSGLTELLNTSFRTNAFTSGFPFGTASLALTGR